MYASRTSSRCVAHPQTSGSADDVTAVVIDGAGLALVFNTMRRRWVGAIGVGEAGDAGIDWRCSTVSAQFAEGGRRVSGAIEIVGALDAAASGGAGAGTQAFNSGAVVVDLAARRGAGV